MESTGPVSTPSGRRRYDSQNRRAEARARRRRIVAVAHDLFLERGYAGTAIEEIAAAAEVSVQTVYAVFGSKAGLLARVIDIAIGGDDEDLAVRDRPAFRALLEADHPRVFVRALARFARESHERSGPILHLLDSVAGTDPALDELAVDLRRQAHEESGFIIDRIPPAWLRPGLTREDRVALASALGYHQTWWTLTRERGWSARRYESFLAKALLESLLISDP